MRRSMRRLHTCHLFCPECLPFSGSPENPCSLFKIQSHAALPFPFSSSPLLSLGPAPFNLCGTGTRAVPGIPVAGRGVECTCPSTLPAFRAPSSRGSRNHGQRADLDRTAGKNDQGPGTQKTAQVALARESPALSLLRLRVTEKRAS